MESEFTFELAQKLYGSEEIIDFDWAYQVLGYSTKSNAKRMLVGYFERDFDYFIQSTSESLESLPYDIFINPEENSKPGRPVEKIYLTVNCFKEMGMLAKSKEGKQIRRYFLRCESIAKSAVANYPQLQQQVQNLQQAVELLQSQIQNLLPQVPAKNTMPPGWNPETWNNQSPQDKRHFRYLYRRRNFRPSDQGTTKPVEEKIITSEEIKARANQEIQAAIGEVTEEEKERLDAAKKKALLDFEDFEP